MKLKQLLFCYFLSIIWFLGWTWIAIIWMPTFIITSIGGSILIILNAHLSFSNLSTKGIQIFSLMLVGLTILVNLRLVFLLVSK